MTYYVAANVGENQMSWRDKYWRVWLRCMTCGNVRSRIQQRAHHAEPPAGRRLYILCSPENDGGKCVQYRYHTVLGGLEARMREAQAMDK